MVPGQILDFTKFIFCLYYSSTMYKSGCIIFACGIGQCFEHQIPSGFCKFLQFCLVNIVIPEPPPKAFTPLSTHGAGKTPHCIACASQVFWVARVVLSFYYICLVCLKLHGSTRKPSQYCPIHPASLTAPPFFAWSAWHFRQTVSVLWGQAMLSFYDKCFLWLVRHLEASVRFC